ncbi:hypothetical protein CEXT_689641 [Caerostris extrusa]|uniref:Uncharacterized protein n=1 Tax=Caerostris extrusa TaxID=172846 RepID=A0AAV4X7E9_CAEEX|nr:hypothetical protein CEXT_689641 [Caerostris extrusa]
MLRAEKARECLPGDESDCNLWSRILPLYIDRTVFAVLGGGCFSVGSQTGVVLGSKMTTLDSASRFYSKAFNDYLVSRTLDKPMVSTVLKCN